MKCSVPFGRVSMALRFMISEQTAASLGYFSARSSRYSREKSPIAITSLTYKSMLAPAGGRYNKLCVNKKKFFFLNSPRR